MTRPELDSAIARSTNFFASFVGFGTIPYGEHSPGRGSHESNGKVGNLAIAFALEGSRPDAAQYNAKLATASAAEREIGHNGAWFNYLWAPLGANVGGEEAAADHFSRISWRLDLNRRWNGGFNYDCWYEGHATGSPKFLRSSGEFWANTAMLLTYAMPLRQTYMTGKNQNTSAYLSSAEVSETAFADNYDATTRTTSELVADLGFWSYKVQFKAGQELGNRTSEHATLVPQLIAIADNTGAGEQRVGACFALGEIGDGAAAATLAALLTDGDEELRWSATHAMRYMPDSERLTHLNTMLTAAVSMARTFDPVNDPYPTQFAYSNLCKLLFNSGSSGGPLGVIYGDKINTLGVDRNLLYPAIEAAVGAPDGSARSSMASTFLNLTQADIEALAGSLVDVVQYPAPGDMMTKHQARNGGLQALQANNYAEGVPLAKLLANDHTYSNRIKALNVLKWYAGSSTLVNPDPKIIEFCEYLAYADLLVTTGSPDIDHAQEVLDAIAADLNPVAPISLKSIQSVTAQNPSLQLPAIYTNLDVVATDLAEGDSIYTWRKVHGAGEVTFAFNGTAAAKNTTVLFGGAPGNYLFEVTMSDSRGLTEVSDTVAVTLNNSGGGLPANTGPSATPQSVNVSRSNPAPIELSGSDPEGYELTYSVTSSPSQGTLSGTPPNLVYTPNINYVGADQFTFHVMDSEGLTDTAAIDLTVSSTAVVETAIYEPFDYPSVSTLNGQSGASEVGLDGSWTAASDGTTLSDGSLTFGSLSTTGRKYDGVAGGSWGGSRPISPSALASTGLLNDGSTLWIAAVVGMDAAANNTNATINLGLANNSFAEWQSSVWIVDDGALLGSGIGFSMGNIGGKGRTVASQFRDRSFKVEANDVSVHGSRVKERAAVVQPGEHMYVVCKITWNEDPLQPDLVEVFQPTDANMVLPSEPISVLEAVVDQSTFDTLTFNKNDKVLMDEIRVGPSYYSVMAGTQPITVDNTAPTLDPVGFDTPPTAVSDTSITMQAGNAYEPTYGVEYYFTCTAGGGNDSGWQSSRRYTDTGLTPGVQYSYTVMARDLSPFKNETSPSAASSVTLPTTWTVLDVVGMPQLAAEDFIVMNSYTVGSVTTVYDEVVPVDAVISQNPAGGASVSGGTAVDLVVSLGPNNSAPVVDAGSDQLLEMAGANVVVNLDATVTDTDAGDVVITYWSVVSAPDEASFAFGDTSAVDTTVSLNMAGDYVLRLTADDQTIETSDEVAITIHDSGAVALTDNMPVAMRTAPAAISVKPGEEGFSSYDGGGAIDTSFNAAVVDYAFFDNGVMPYALGSSGSGGASRISNLTNTGGSDSKTSLWETSSTAGTSDYTAKGIRSKPETGVGNGTSFTVDISGLGRGSVYVFNGSWQSRSDWLKVSMTGVSLPDVTTDSGNGDGDGDNTTFGFSPDAGGVLYYAKRIDFSEATGYDTITITVYESGNSEGYFSGVVLTEGDNPPADTTQPSLASSDIVDGQSGADVTQFSTVNYTITFSEDMDETTVDAADFFNAGSASVSIGAISEISLGVFAVEVTPTTTGTLQLQVAAGAVVTDPSGNALDTTLAITDDTTINVQASGNTAPVASGDSVSTDEDAEVAITLIATDADLDPLTYSVLTGPTYGYLAGTYPNLTYMPILNYSGSDSFTFKANDDKQDSNIATISITVNAANDAPVANSDSATTVEDASVAITLTASDVDVSDALTYTVVSAPINGILAGSEENRTYIPNSDYSGSDSFTFKANDGTVDSNIATVSIMVNAINDAPDVNAGPNQAVTLQDEAAVPGLYYGTVPGNINTTTPNPNTEILVDVSSKTEDAIAQNTTEIYTGKIYDADGSISFTEDIDDAARIWIDGVLVINNNVWNARTSTPNLNLTPGWHDIEIRISNGTGGSGPTTSPGIGYDPAGGTAWQTLVDPGDGSLLRISTPHNAAVTLDGTVTDLEDTPTTTWTFVSSVPTGQSVTFDDASVIDTIATFETVGTYVLRLTGDDGMLQSFDEVTITVSESGGDSAPVANDDSVTTDEDTAVAVTLVATDADGDPLTYTVETQPTNGVLNGTDANLTYTPNADYNGSDSFTFSATGNAVTSNIATVSITVNAINDAPVFTVDPISGSDATEDAAYAGTIAGSATDADTGDSLTYALVSPVTWLSVTSDGTLSGTPTNDDVGANAFTVSVSDGTAAAVNATLNITVINTNDAPVANDDSATTAEDTSVAITLTASDVDVSDTLSYTVVSAPTNGILTGSEENLTYTPNSNYNGADSFTFRVNDNTVASNTATVSIMVNAVDDAPVASNDVVSADEDTAVAVTLVAADADGDSLTYTVEAQPTNGVLSGTDANLTYTPNADYNGSDSFTFSATGNAVTSNIATVSITVNAINDAPVFTVDPISGSDATEDAAYASTLSDDASDADGDTLSYALVGSSGWLAVTSNGDLSGTPANADVGSNNFTVSVSDGINPAVEATLTIEVSNTNDAPVANDDSATTDEDVTLAITLVAADLDAGDSLTYEVVTPPTNGILTGTAPDLTYTPNSDYNGSDSFTFVANDGTTDSNTATVSLTINAINDAPVFSSDPFSASDATEGGAYSDTIAGSATDVDAAASLTYALVSAQGWLFIASDGTLSGTPGSGDVGSNSFIVSVSDGIAPAVEATLNITVYVPITAVLADVATVAAGGNALISVTPGHFQGFSSNNGTVDTAFNKPVLDYRFYGNNPAYGSSRSGGASRFSDLVNQQANNDYTDYWTTSDPLTQVADVTNSGTRTGTSADGLTSGTVDISGLTSGSLYIFHGRWQSGTTDYLEVVMSGDGQLDVTLPAAGATIEGAPIMWVTRIDFSDADAYDTITFTHYVNDGAAGGYFSSVVLTQAPAGDTTPPILAGSDIVDDRGGAGIDENTLVTYTVSFSEDMDQTTVDATDFSNAGTSTVTIGTIAEISPGVFTVEATPTNAGTLQLQVNAAAQLSDVAGNSLDTAVATAADTVITVEEANVVPVWVNNPVNETDASEDIAYASSLTDNASDANTSDTLSFAKVSGPAWLSVAIDGTLSGTPGNDDVGANIFTVSVTDNEIGTPLEAMLNITVINANDAPIVDAGLPQTVYSIGGASVSPASGAAIFLDAGLDDGINSTWEDSVGLWDPTINAGVAFVADAGSSLEGITSAYDFPGDLSGDGGCFGPGLQDMGVDNLPYTMEIWFKPDASATYPTNGQVLWETGGGTGIGIFYNNGFVETAHDSNQAQISADVSSLTGEFIQVAVTYDPTNSVNNFNLYINGSLAATASRSDTDMCGGDDSGLGRRGGNNVGGAGGGDSSTESFDGQIAIFRAYHNQILSLAQVTANYDSIASTNYSAVANLDGDVSDPDSGDSLTTTWSVLSAPVGGSVIFGDGSAVDTTATFDMEGDYTLRLTADDSAAQSHADVVITVDTPLETIAPTLASSDIVDDQGGANVTPDTLVTYTVTFSEDMDASTVSATDFSNAGTAPTMIGVVTEIAAGVFTVEATPTAEGTLQLQVSAGAVLTDLIGNPLDTTSGIADGNLIMVTSGQASGPKLVRMTATGVSSDSWTMVSLGQTYNSPVIVATPIYPAGQQIPVVTRITNVTTTGFDLKLDRADSQAGVVSFDVSIIAVDEGVYSQASDGVTLEAAKFTSSITAYKNSWTAELRSYVNSYTNPVVLGQVMSANDNNWSAFWCMGSSAANPPDASNLAVGKHVGEDPNNTRADEEIGYIVIESGNGSINGIAYEAGLGNDIVEGLTNSSSPYTYSLSGTLNSVSAAAVTQAAMDGVDGSWAVLSEPTPFSTTNVSVYAAEDTLGDSEQAHTNEQVGYIVFE